MMYWPLRLKVQGSQLQPTITKFITNITTQMLHPFTLLAHMTLLERRDCVKNPLSNESKQQRELIDVCVPISSCMLCPKQIIAKTLEFLIYLDKYFANFSQINGFKNQCLQIYELCCWTCGC